MVGGKGESKSREAEALVVCGDRNMGAGINLWDLDSGNCLLHIPTCASPTHGLLCLRGQVLVASQANRHGSVGCGAIFAWHLKKPQSPIRSYPIEAIGPLASTFNGMYLVGGAFSGNAYLWEVTSGRLLKTWRAHHKSLKCIAFSNDDSILISGSDDGMINAWSVIGLLDVEDVAISSSLLHFSMEHKSSITSLLSTSGISNSCFISTSLDSTCKVWDLVSRRLIQTRVYPTGITAATLHPTEQLIFCGSTDGRIFVSGLDLGLVDEPIAGVEDQQGVLKGQNGSITALTFSKYGLISASTDSTVCLWDIISQVIVWRIDHQKGPATNLVVVPHCSELFTSPSSSHEKNSSQFCFSSLDKCTQQASPSEGVIALPPSCCLYPNDFQSSLDHQIFEMEQEQTPTMQMKIETIMGQRMWATQMTNHVMEMNKHLQSRVLDLMQVRLLLAGNNATSGKNKKLVTESKAPSEEEVSSQV
ncbi:unnamed protein product [Linum trigynum]|uniref:Protein ROOT INITIATION DEFECTIVE 3-like n=1 Tax=Linum trigynum TaxID=586398 RepID=A0AAV2ETF4_9ROSI